MLIVQLQYLLTLENILIVVRKNICLATSQKKKYIKNKG